MNKFYHIPNILSIGSLSVFELLKFKLISIDKEASERLFKNFKSIATQTSQTLSSYKLKWPVKIVKVYFQ